MGRVATASLGIAALSLSSCAYLGHSTGTRVISKVYKDGDVVAKHDFRTFDDTKDEYVSFVDQKNGLKVMWESEERDSSTPQKVAARADKYVMEGTKEIISTGLNHLTALIGVREFGRSYREDVKQKTKQVRSNHSLKKYKDSNALKKHISDNQTEVHLKALELEAGD